MFGDRSEGTDVPSTTAHFKSSSLPQAKQPYQKKEKNILNAKCLFLKQPSISLLVCGSSLRV
jgi:hypothetical protein